MTSVQAAMNQMMSNIAHGALLGMSAVKPQIEKYKEQKALDMEIEKANEPLATAKETPEDWDKYAEVEEKQAEAYYRQFKDKLTKKNREKAYDEYAGHKELADNARWMAQDMREEAEAKLMNSISTKTDTQIAQKSALDERLDFLKQLNQEGIMSNTQMKKYEHRIKQGGNQ